MHEIYRQTLDLNVKKFNEFSTKIVDLLFYKIINALLPMYFKILPLSFQNFHFFYQFCNIQCRHTKRGNGSAISAVPG